jgi:L-ribulose-5-phosphate 3-epimerase
MTTSIDRRQVLRAAATLPLATALLPKACPTTPLGSAPLFTISLAQWSLHRTLQSGKLDHLDFAKVAKQDFGIDGVEYVNSFFKTKAKDEAYLKDMKSRADDLGVRSLLIMVDGEGALGDADERKRTAAIDNHRKWLDAARSLKCHSIRVNAQSSGTWEEQRDRAADGLRRLADLGAEAGLDVIVENHGGLSSNGKWLAEVITKVKHPRCGTLPDFGNFNLGGGKTYDRYQGVTELMPFAKAVSAKSHAFDESGNEIHTDYRRMLTIVTKAGYRGFIGIEFEGDKHGEMDGIRLTRDLLIRVRSELQQAK